jgi:hypothetical protein
MDEQKQNEDQKKTVGEPPKKVSIGIPLRLIPNDKAALEAELQELFDEDKVVHRQGNSEPEAD